MRWVYMLLFVLLTGCHQHTASPFVAPSVLTLCDFGPLNIGDDQWLKVITEYCKQENIPDPIVVSSHGNTVFLYDRNGRLVGTDWALFFQNPTRVVPAKMIAESLHALFPQNSIWLSACNPGGFTLNIPNVYFAKGNVHVIPDKYAKGIYAHETERGSGAVGSPEEFICLDVRKRVRLAGER